MGLGDLDVPFRPEHARCPFDEVGEQRDAERRVRRAQDGDLVCRFSNPLLGQIVEPGGARRRRRRCGTFWRLIGGRGRGLLFDERRGGVKISWEEGGMMEGLQW